MGLPVFSWIRILIVFVVSSLAYIFINSHDIIIFWISDSYYPRKIEQSLTFLRETFLCHSVVVL